MATIKDTALCIRHWDWSETSQTVSLFTRSHGIIRGIAKGSKREKGPFSGGLELLTLGQVIAITKASSSLATITTWDLRDAYPVARRSLRAFFVGSYLMDLIHHALTDHDPHPTLFANIANACTCLATSPDAALLIGQWAVLVETGYRPEICQDVQTGEPLTPDAALTFAPRLGGVTIIPPAHLHTGQITGWRVRYQTIELLQMLDAVLIHTTRKNAKQNQSEQIPARFPPDAIARAGRLLGSYLRQVLGRDLPTMQPVFGENGLASHR